MAATNKRGVFSLEKVLERQDSNNWSKIPEVFRYVNSIGGSSPAGTDYGYFMGGWAECCPYLAPFSTVDRLDFSNDTDDMVTKASLTETRSYMRGFSSLTHGYTAGGANPFPNAPKSSTDRIDYASDTTAQVTKGPLATGAAGNIVGVHNTDYGYSLGGWGGPGNSDTYSLSQRLDFSNDTATMSPKGNLTSEKNYGAGAGNQSYGYYSGGTPSRISSVDRIDYSSDTTALAPKGPLSRAVNEHDAAGNADYGYHAGGWDPSSPYSDVNDRIDYSSDTSTATTKGNTGGKHGPTATGNTSYGYWTGGYGNTTNSYRLDYSSDTTNMAVKGKRTSVSQNGCGTSSRANAMPLVLSTNTVPATRTEANSSPAGTNFGYTFGGLVGNYNTLSYTIQRIDFANDTATASVPSSMTNTSPSDAGNAGGFAVASLTHAYAGQSPNPSASSSIQRLDLSNDTTNASVHANMPETAFQTNGVGNSDYGYICGNDKTSTSRIDYSNDTATTSPKGDLTVERGSAGVTGTPSYGYVGSGWKSNFFTTTSKTDRIDYSNDTATAVVVGNMTFSKHNPTATGNLSYGWFNQGGPGLNTRICRLDYSSDTTDAVNKGSLSASTYGRGATGDQSYGYFAGGFSPSPSSHETVVCRIDYANDTPTSSTKGPLTTGLFYSRMASSRANGLPFLAPKTVDKGADGYVVAGSLGPAYGYFSGGFNPSNSPAHPSAVYYSNVDRVDFASDTSTASPRGKLDQARANAAAAGSLSHGYIGATDLTSGYTTIVARVDYANDSATAVVKGSMNPGINRWQAVTSNTSYAWFSGGQPTASTVQRIDFGNDTATASVKGSLSLARQAHGGAGNADYGWHAGGYNWPAPDYIRSVVDRIDYSNDSVTATPKGPLSVKRRGLGSTGNASYGWHGGGYNVAPGNNNWVTNVDRIDYSNDTATATPKGPLSQTRSRGSATGNTSYGYFVGGEGNNDNGLSTVDRIDFSSDTPTAATKGPLTYSARGYSGFSARANALQGTPSFIPRIRWVDSAAETPAVSAGPAYGYWGGGYASSILSTVDRVDYSSDTDAASPKGSLSSTRYNSAATGNTSYGYFGGGGAPTVSTVDRIDYSSDTSTASPKGPLSVARIHLAATGNASYGYFAGGYPGPNTTVDRIDYSSDTGTTPTKGPLSQSRYALAATGNTSYGYFGGGQDPGFFSTVDRIDYSNDTGTTPTKGPLSLARRRLAATGNASYGYFGGGSTPSLVSTVDRIDYSSDTSTAAAKGSLSDARHNFSATGNNSHGYFGGGTSPSTVSTIDRVDFSNDTATAAVKGSLSSARYLAAAASAQANGLPSTSTAAIAAPVQPPFPYPQQLTDPNFGYWIGGSGPSYSSTVDRVDWATDTGIAATKGPLSSDWMYMGAAVASPSYAYNGGGARSTGPSSSENYSTVIDRIDFTNDSATATPKGNLSGGKNRLAATGNASYGYFGGGFVQNPSVIDRVDYGNDTATATPKGPLNDNRWAPAATGNQSYGYFCGGMDTTNVDRVEYANDTPTASPKGKLSQKHNYAGATGNASYGYVGGGQSNDPAKYSSIDRIDFSNDTATSVLKGPLTAETEGVSATGNTSYGWWGGGQVPPGPNTSKLDRLDFSNDTATTSPRGILSLQRNQASAASPTANANPN